jgi:hypothetical protein
VRTAARNNAELVDVVCASHEISGTFAADSWTSSRRTPAYYPDAVTLERDVDASALLSRIDDSSGASIKDSFGTLDLSGHGYRVLFDGEWIGRGPADETDGSADRGAQWSAVKDAAGLEAWEAAWSEDGSVRGAFPATLLGDAKLVFVSGESDGAIVAGAVLNRSEGAVGLSNTFFTTGAPAGGWAGCVGETSSQFPGVPIVGYEPEDLLGGPHGAGFDSIGPMRVWIRD